MAFPFTMDYSSGASPDAGWGAGGAYADTTKHTITRLASGGPTSQAAYEMRVDYDAGGSDFGGQFNYGWRNTLDTTVGYGESFYIRWRMKFSADTNFRGRDWGDGGLSGMIDKVIIVNDGCSGSNCREVTSLEGDFGTGQFYIRIQKDGGADVADTPLYSVNVWLNIQIGIFYSSVNGAADGGYSIWVNNDNFGSPTATRSTILNATSAPCYVKFGGFQNHGVASDGVFKWIHSDFQAGLTFNNAWNAPAAPVTETTQFVVVG